MAIYINPSWAGAESGTKAEPYIGIESMVGSVGFSTGETYYCKAGTTDTLTTGISLTSSVSNITIGSYTDTEDDSYVGSSRPIIAGASGFNTFQIGSLGVGPNTGTTLKDLDIVGDSGTAARCVYIFAAALTDSSPESNTTIDNCIIREGGLQNLRLYTSRITITNCTIYDADTDNVFVAGGNDVTIDNNVIYGSGRGGVQADGIQVIPIAVGNANNLTITNNNITNLSGIKNCVIGPPAAATGGVITDNTLNAECIAAADIKGVSTVFARNTIFSNVTKAVIVVNGATTVEVYGNLIIDSSVSIVTDNWKSIIFVTDDNGIYHNNTIITTNTQGDLAGITFNTIGSTGNVVTNCVIDGVDYGILQNAILANTESYNHYYNISTVNHGDQATKADLGTTEATTGDPLIESNYKFSPNSPVIGVGAKWWTGANPAGNDGEPFSDFDVDKGHVQSTYGPFHTKNL